MMVQCIYSFRLKYVYVVVVYISLPANGHVSMGSTNHLGSTLDVPRPFDLTSKSEDMPYAATAIVGVSFAPGTDGVCYAWYDDGRVSYGTSSNLGITSLTTDKYILPTGINTKTGKAYDAPDIVGIAISSVGVYYAWYNDGNMSTGHTHTNLDDISNGVIPYVLATNTQTHKAYSPTDVVGIAISSDDTTYAWYSDERVSNGTSNSITSTTIEYDFPHNPQTHQKYVTSDIVDISISSDDTTYAWFSH